MQPIRKLRLFLININFKKSIKLNKSLRTGEKVSSFHFFFKNREQNEHEAHLVVSDTQKSVDTQKVLRVHCRHFKNEKVLFLKVFKSYPFGNLSPKSVMRGKKYLDNRMIEDF